MGESMTDEHDFPDYDGDALDKLERIIDKSAELRSPEPLGIADVRVSGTPEAQEKFFAAFAEATLEFGPIKKTKCKEIRTRDRGSYTIEWAPLSEVLAATRPALAKHGITVWQPWSGPHDGMYRVTTWVRGHGACVEARVEFQRGSSPQDTAAQITYARRYSMNAILSLDADSDIDDEGEDVPRPPQARQRPPQMPDGPPGQTSARQAETPSQKPAQAPPAAQARPRSEPPPKPAARPRSAPHPAPRAEGGFAARVAQARGHRLGAEHDDALRTMREIQAQDPLTADPRHMVIPGAVGPDDFPGSDEGSHYMNSRQGHGDRPTAPVPEPKPAPKGAEVVTVDEQFDPEKFSEFESLTKALNLKGPQLRQWTVERINKPPEQATPADLDFLLDAAKEELQARAS